jgi:hypothetical protein
MSRNTVRKISRTGQTEFVYSKRESRCGAVGPFIEKLGGILEQEMGLPVKNRRTIKKIFEQLQREGYEPLFPNYDYVSGIGTPNADKIFRCLGPISA